MKSSSLAAFTLSALAAAGAAHAQESVNVYGLLDAGIESVSNVQSVGRITRMPSNTATIPSRVGMRGREDLGGGLGAVFTLEMGIAPDTGASGQGGRLFGRQALVGLAGDWGAVTLGRQYTMTFWSLLDSDLVGPTVYGLGALDAYIPNSRADNSIVYRGKFSDLSVGVGYSLGRDAVNAAVPSPAATNCAGENGADAKACREWSAMVKYDTKEWGAAVAYDSFNGRTPGAAPDAVFGGMTKSSLSDSRLMVNGYVSVAAVKLAAGVIHRKNEGSLTRPKSDLWYLGASYPVTSALTVDGHVAKLAYKDVDNFDSTIVTVKAMYSLSKRTSVYAQIGTIRNDRLTNVSVSSGAPGSNPALGGSQTGTMVGIKHTF